MSVLPIEQRNPYKGTPARPWVQLRFTERDGTPHEPGLAAQGGQGIWTQLNRSRSLLALASAPIISAPVDHVLIVTWNYNAQTKNPITKEVKALPDYTDKSYGK